MPLCPTLWVNIKGTYQLQMQEMLEICLIYKATILVIGKKYMGEAVRLHSLCRLGWKVV